MFQFEEVHKLYGNHLEVNFRVKFHVNHAYKNGNGNIIVRVTDTDITIFLTCNANLLTNIHLWYDFGVDYNNSREYLDVTKLSKCLTYVQALPGIYTFTENDYSAILQKSQNQIYYCNEKNVKILLVHSWISIIYQ